MNKEKIAGIILLALIAVIVAFYVLHGVTIKETIYKAKEDFEKEQTGNCMNYLSDKFFVGHKYTREQLNNRARELFAQVEGIEVQISNLEIKEESETGWAKTSVKIFAAFNKQKIVILGHPLKPFEGELFFEKEDGKWKIVKATKFPI